MIAKKIPRKALEPLTGLCKLLGGISGHGETSASIFKRFLKSMERYADYFFDQSWPKEYDFDALRFWAEKADYEKWREDRIGKILGVGLTTFQYLRLQAGINTTVPDRIIRRVAEKEFGIIARDSIDFIRKMEEYSSKVGFSQILFCWAAWLK